MNTNRIIQAAKDIEASNLALGWLQGYGRQIPGKDSNGHASVTIDLKFAGSCPGAPEAAKLIASYARFRLPEAVDDAIACCRNTIAMAVDAIRAETSEHS